MVRNLYISKRRPWNPERSWRKIAGPRDVSLMMAPIPIRSGRRTTRRTAATGDVENPLGGEHALARQRRREAVERQAEQLLDEGMGLGGAIEIDEHARVHAEALARLERVGERRPGAPGGTAKNTSSTTRSPCSSSGRSARIPMTGAVEHGERRVRRVQAQAAAHDPARLRVAHESGDEAAGALARAHHEGDARPALAPSRAAEPGEDEAALGPEPRRRSRRRTGRARCG